VEQHLHDISRSLAALYSSYNEARQLLGDSFLDQADRAHFNQFLVQQWREAAARAAG